MAAVSDRLLIGRACLKVFVHDGINPQRSRSSRRSPVSGWRRITMASLLGATFQFGARLGTGPDVANSERIASGGRWEAKRPHMA